MAEIMYREALNQALFEEMRRDPKVLILGEGVAERGGSNKITEGLLNEFGPHRVVDTPLAEATIAGAAVGAALAGTRPISEIMFVDFTTLTMDQIINQAAKYELMSGGQGKVPMVLRTQGGAGNGLAGQHSQSLEAIFYHIPGLKVVMPATPHDAKGLLKASIRDNDPVIFIEHKLLYMTRGEVPETDYVVPLGQAEIKCAGTDITLISYSLMTLKCLEAAEILAGEGISVEVVDLRTISPLDKGTLLESVRKTGRAIVVHEAVKRGGIGGDIVAMLTEEAYDDLDGPIMRICGKNTTIPYNLKLEKACIPSTADIIEGILALV